MNTEFFSRYEQHLDSLDLAVTGCDSRGAEHWETVFRRATRGGTGTQRYPGNAGNRPRSSAPPSQTGTCRVRRQVRYVLIHQAGPLAEFETWGEAFRYMLAHPVEGGSIIRNDEQTTEWRNPTDGTVGLASVVPGLDKTPIQAAKTVLVIDHEIGTLLSTTKLVQESGHNVVIARDTAEAVETIRSAKPDLILADIDLANPCPGRGGLGLIEWMSFHYPAHRMKYIVVSSGELEELTPRALALGAFAFLKKPLAMDELLNEVRRAIGDPEQNPEP